MRERELLFCALIMLPASSLAASTEGTLSPREAVDSFVANDPKKVQRAREKILAAPDEAMPALLETLKSPKAEHRIRVLRIMRDIKSPAVYKAASDSAKNDSQWMVRTEAIDLVSRSAISATDELLEDIAAKDANRMARASALRWYSHRKKKAAIGALKRLLDDSDLLVSIEAAKELGRNGDDAGHQKAKAQVSNQDLYIRSAAVEALGTIGKSEDISVLKSIENNQSEHQHVRVAATRSRMKIEFQKIPVDKRNSYLEAKLSDESWGIRSWAVDELFRVAKRDKPLVQGIIGRISADSKNPGVEDAQRLSRLIAVEASGDNP